MDYNDAWYRNLSRHIYTNGRDGEGENLGHGALMDLRDRPWWETYADMEHMVRYHLSIPINRYTSGTRRRLADLIAQHYEFEG